MTEDPNDYCPAPGNVWSVNASNKAPAFLSTGSFFNIKNFNNSFKLVLLSLPNEPTFDLEYRVDNLYMSALPFKLTPTDRVQYLISFKLAMADSIGRGAKTLYCTTQIEEVNEAGEVVGSSEQGVFGAEEDGGGATDELGRTP